MIYSSEFPCKGKDFICFGFFARAQKCLLLVLHERTQLVVGAVLIYCVLSSSPPGSSALLQSSVSAFAQFVVQREGCGEDHVRCT